MEKQTETTKNYHHGRLRETLIEAGVTILEEEGIHALSLRKVAKRAEVSHAAPYRHFEDKSDLLAAIAEAGFKQLGGKMEQAIGSNKADPHGQMFDIGRCYVGFGIAHPAQLTLRFSDLLKEGKSESLREAAGYTFELLTQSVVNAQAAGMIKPGDPAGIARVVWSLEHGLAMLMKEGFFDDGTPEDRTRKISESLNHLLAGLAA